MCGKPCELEKLIGEVVVVDTTSPFLYIGTLRRVGEEWVVLADASLHDTRDGGGTREFYILQAKKLGVRVNRREILIRLGEVVSLSKLEEVVES